MPKLSKEALSRFIRTGCDRQLRLTLATDAERSVESMPGKQPPRPGLQDASDQGIQWQHEKVTDLINTFGRTAVVAKPKASGVDYAAIDLDDNLTKARAVVGVSEPTVWLVEPAFEIGAAFEAALGLAAMRQRLNITYAGLRPDLVEVLPPSTGDETQVTPNGDTVQLAAGDQRMRLRVIDIKLTAEPSPGYFAEVTLYSMALAGWLEDHGRSHEFVVTADAALWPGSHEASALAVAVAEARRATGSQPTAEAMRAALSDDLEPVPFEVFVPEVRRFFQQTVPDVLAVPWQDTQYHVDNRCKSCSFLGAPWKNAEGVFTAEPGHCMKVAAAQGHLSKVAYVSRGARNALEKGGIGDVSTLAQRTAADPALNEHHVLRGSRTVVQHRASVLDGNKAAEVAPKSGTTAVMPRWSDLRIHVSVDFDASSAISFAFAVTAFWQPPFAAKQKGQTQTMAWPTRVFIVDQRSVQTEERELMAFLAHLRSILTAVTDKDDELGLKKGNRSGYQLYLWDQLQLRHLSRVIGRHLPVILSDPAVRDLAWLFPSDELVLDPDVISRKSPVTVVRDIVRSLVAAPVDHYYSLLELARHYHPVELDENLAKFNVHPLFQDSLSDQIPSERAHEIWTRSSNPNRPWPKQLQILEETVKTRLRACEQVRRRLEDDLRGQLQSTAPKIRPGGMKPATGLAQMSQLWLAHAKIDRAFGELEVSQVRAMPPHERESKFRSARLERRLLGDQRAEALAKAGAAGVEPTDFVYRMRAGSREVKMREGEFGVALAPELQPSLLDQRLARIINGTPITLKSGANDSVLMEKILAMTVVAIDRDNLVMILRPDAYWSSIVGVPDLVDQIELHTSIDLSKNCILDPVYNDFFVKKLQTTLTAIKNPPSAVAASSTTLANALGDRRPQGSKKTGHVPAADLLWDAAAMHTTRVVRNVASARARLEIHGVELNQSQWDAWTAALTLRLQPIWGPPGTGKSKTLRAIALGAVVAAYDDGEPLRLLVGASNYKALDNVLGEVATELPALLGADADLEVHRLRSAFQAHNTTARDVEVAGKGLSQDAIDLANRLTDATGITVVGATPEQLHNLLLGGMGGPMAPAFDLMLLDEASQTDVAHATLFAAAMAEECSVVPAGDTRQLPPITQAQPPLNLEALVGSFMGLLENAYGIEPVALNINYRSNETIVALAHVAGYETSLRASSPNLMLDLDPAGEDKPDDWPQELPYTPAWGELLNPLEPVTAFVYDDKNWSSQSNGFEAQVVAALLTELFPRMGRDLLNELDSTGVIIDRGPRAAINSDEFWKRGVGIVTPHRAQQAMVLTELERAFPAARAELLRGAVDTVERFQGQQRDVIIVSYALGDADAIAEEDEFLMSFNRFNVAASRARAKLIVLVSQQVISHLSSEVEVLRASSLLKQFATTFCFEKAPLVLPHGTGPQASSVPGRRVWRP